MSEFDQGLCTPNTDDEVIETVLRTLFRSISWGAEWDTIPANATLVITPDGSPIRTIVTGRRNNTSGIYASRKVGRPIVYESMIERDFFMHSEVDSKVTAYRPQPFRFEFAIDGQKRTYIVDCLRVLSDGTIEIVEIKKDSKSLRDPNYSDKLSAVRTLCECKGLSFRVVFEAQLRKPRWLYDNIVEIQSWRHTAFSNADVFDVAAALQRKPEMALAELAETLGDQLQGIAKLKAMVIHRIVQFDLSQVLSPRTIVRMVDEPLRSAS